ncbi:hypothetical protein KKG72_02970 [bacterium]|nr:hypothetical protein [bacterium]MBU1994148.1 hypothetical protein [bacterium]
MHYILIIFFLFSSLLHSKQSDFSIIIDRPFNDALFDITEDYDRGMSGVGFSNNYKTSSFANKQAYTDAFEYLQSVSNAKGSQMHLLKVDNSANIILNKTANLTQFNEAVAVVKTPSNGYFVGGYTLNGSILILQLDSNGNILFYKTFGTKNYDRLSKLVQLNDGGVLAVGSSVTSRSQHDNLFETGLGLNDIYISRFSKNGNLLWSKKYGTDYDDIGIDAVEAFDGSIIVISTTSYDNNKNLTLMRVTENGDKIWLKHHREDERITPHKIIKLRDNNFLISLSYVNDMKKEQIRLMKFDLHKNILLDNKISTQYSSVLKDIKEYSDSKLIGVGYVRDSYNTDALAMIFNSELNMLHQEHYGEENFDVFNAVTILHNSQAAAAGIHTNENSQESNMWIVKLNRDATIASKSSKASDLFIELSKLFQDEIHSRELIIKKDLSIEFVDAMLYFEIGEYALTRIQEDFLIRFSKKIMPFLQTHQEQISTLEINGHTSSEWGNSNFTNTYLKNEELSMRRSYAVLSFIYLSQERSQQLLLSKIIKGSGLNYSKKIIVNKKEDLQKSRRVSFKIILN